jgi:hypothetical protein
MDSSQQAPRIEQARRRMRRIALTTIPIQVASLVGLYFIAPLPEVVAIAALFVVGGGATMAADRQMGAIAARAGEPLKAPDAPRPIGRRKARLMLGAVMSFYLAFAVAGGVIGHAVGGDDSATVVGGVSGSFVSYALMLTGLRLYKRRHRSPASD